MVKIRSALLGLIAATAFSTIGLGQDIARPLVGQPATKVFTEGEPAQAIQRVMGRDYRSAIVAMGPRRTWSYNDVKTQDPYTVGYICKAHECGDHMMTVVFDKNGRAWVSVVDQGQIRFYGNPPEEVQKILRD